MIHIMILISGNYKREGEEDFIEDKLGIRQAKNELVNESRQSRRVYLEFKIEQFWERKKF